MKIDPNQMVGGFLASVLVSEHPVTGDQSFEDKHVGGTPMRVAIAAPIVSEYIGTRNVALNPADSQRDLVCRLSLAWADALIAEHNATAGEVGGG